MIHAALVLEGGALRGLFTAGVLDVLMERGVRFDYVNGVSAGALNGINYASGQIGRSLRVNADFVRDRRYVGLNNLLLHGGIFNFDFLFGEIADSLLPFDAAAFEQSPMTLECVVTSCVTGQPVFYRHHACADYMLAARASASMPLLSREVMVDGVPCLDGGVSLPIAYDRALSLGYDKVVVVLTREQGYRKPREDRVFGAANDIHYAQYPDFLRTLHRIPDHYNEMQEEMDALVRAGRLFLIRPAEPVELGRTERNPQRLEALYERGRHVMNERFDAMMAFCKDAVPAPCLRGIAP